VRVERLVPVPAGSRVGALAQVTPSARYGRASS
jgi:hypothetical protein